MRSQWIQYSIRVSGLTPRQTQVASLETRLVVSWYKSDYQRKSYNTWPVIVLVPDRKKNT